MEVIAEFKGTAENTAVIKSRQEEEAALPIAAKKRLAIFERRRRLLDNAFLKQDQRSFNEALDSLRTAFIADLLNIGKQEAGTQTDIPPWVHCPLPHKTHSRRGVHYLNRPF
jgi:hypothetical protein